VSLSANFQPLYKQVYELLVSRLVDNHWKPSESLPSEHALAAELGVSQGTVRKALNQMVAEQLLCRRQGKGTYVSEHTQESSLYRFFRFKESGGENLIPDTRVLRVESRKAREKEIDVLNLQEGDLVCQMVRLRSLFGKPTILERVIQPLEVFPGLDKLDDLPNSLYSLYQEKYGVSIVSVNEEVRATNLKSDQAELLEISQDIPVLLVERSSFSIDGRVVEWSQSLCSTEKYVYAVSLR